MPKNGRLEIVAASMLLACSPFSVRSQQLPTTSPTGAIAADGADAAAAVVAPPPRHPNPPHVICAGDQLTVKANYSLLSSVLDAVHACIGVKIALPDGFVDGPVFFELGPGPTREVLDSLLNASDVDFAILLSPTDPEKVVTVEIMTRSTGLRDANAPDAAMSGPMTPARRAWLATRNLGRGMPPAEASTAEPSSNDIGTGGSGSAGHADASPAVSLSTPETRLTGATADAGASTNAAAAGATVSINPAASDAGASSNAAVAAAGAGAAINATASDAGASSNAAVAGNTAPSQDAVATTAGTPTPAAPTDPNAVTPADQEFQQKITNMQQLFEQRKKLNATPATTPDSNAAPATNPS